MIFVALSPFSWLKTAIHQLLLSLAKLLNGFVEDY
jgi:hypothetical protein